MSFITAAGSTDVSSTIRVLNTNGTPKTDVLAASGIDLYYVRQGGASVQIAPLSDLASESAAHTDGGIYHKGNGLYRVDIPDAAFAEDSGVDYVEIYGDYSGYLVVPSLHILNIAPAIRYDELDEITLKGTVVTVTDASTFTATLADRDGTAVEPTQANIFQNKSIVALDGDAKYASAEISTSSWDSGNSRTNFALKSAWTLPTAMGVGDTFMISAF